MYQDFLKCLMLYNNRELRMTASELMLMIHPFCLLVPIFRVVSHLDQLCKFVLVTLPYIYIYVL